LLYYLVTGKITVLIRFKRNPLEGLIAEVLFIFSRGLSGNHSATLIQPVDAVRDCKGVPEDCGDGNPRESRIIFCGNSHGTWLCNPGYNGEQFLSIIISDRSFDTIKTEMYYS